MHSQTVTIIIILFIFSIIYQQTLACFFAISGGFNKTIDEKVERAPIVIVGYVLNTTTPDPQTTFYSAFVSVNEIYKGKLLLQNHLSKDNVILITNGFGSELKCVNSVKSGEWHIFLLKTYQDPQSKVSVLKAQYDDVFGAIVELSDTNLQIVHQVLGWKDWSFWSVCNSSCGSGLQFRSRGCYGDICDYGDNIQSRKCNNWSCKVSKIMEQPENNTLNILLSPNVSVQSFVYTINTISLNKKTFLIINGDNHERQYNISLHLNDLTLSVILENKLQKSKEILNNKNRYVTKLSLNDSHVVLSVVILKNMIQIFADCTEHNLVIPIAPASSSFQMHFNPTPIFHRIVTVVNKSVQCSYDKTYDIPLVLWSSWSECSSSCGSGTQQRVARCRTDDNSCFTLFSNIETKQCRDLPLCDPDRNVAGPETVSSVACYCQNGGTCFDGSCYCNPQYTGVKCEQPICNPPCKNKGLCLKPGYPCHCLKDWGGSDCSLHESISNSDKSTNTETKPDNNDRNDNYFRPKKTIIVCRKRCVNGGICVRRNRCQCAMGYRGRFCHKAKCFPKCRNGGVCVKPGLCQCTAGFIGPSCEQAECFPPCVNGGTCVPNGKCVCAAGFYGRYCQRVNCKHMCLNGGVCVLSEGACRCPPGFYGSRCEDRVCKRQISYKTTYKPVIKILREETYEICPDGVTYCKKHIRKKVILFKIVLKPFFACSTETTTQFSQRVLYLP